MKGIVYPEFEKSAFNCSYCGVYAKQEWSFMYLNNGSFSSVGKMKIAKCDHCNMSSIWVKKQMVYPFSGTAPLPNTDMPVNVKHDYEEARSIASISPRGAAALLRLAVQRLCVHLGEKGKNINDDIASLVSKGLPVKLQKALDCVRVVGNNAVHPGQIDIDDNVEITNKLFVFINIICDNQISQPKMIDDYFDENVPSGQKLAIQKRDN